MIETGNWMLLHDNTSSHTSILLRQFLSLRGVTVLEHPRLKETLKGSWFAVVEKIHYHVTAILQTVPKKYYYDSFQKLYERC